MPQSCNWWWKLSLNMQSSLTWLSTFKLTILNIWSRHIVRFYSTCSIISFICLVLRIYSIWSTGLVCQHRELARGLETWKEEPAENEMSILEKSHVAIYDFWLGCKEVLPKMFQLALVQGFLSINSENVERSSYAIQTFWLIGVEFSEQTFELLFLYYNANWFELLHISALIIIILTIKLMLFVLT